MRRDVFLLGTFCHEDSKFHEDPLVLLRDFESWWQVPTGEMDVP